MSTFIRGVAVAIALVAGALTHAGAAEAATITPNVFSDDVTNNGNCTLREAIISANLDTARDACTAGSGPDVIRLSAGTYSLTLPISGPEPNAEAGDLDVTSDLTITGAAAATSVIQGNGTFRLLHIQASGTDATISDLTLSKGGSENGAGILFESGTTSTLSRVIVTDNTTGGGLFVPSGATVTISASTLTRNTSADAGGAIGNGGALTMTNSTLSGNTSATSGGGIVNLGGATLRLNNVTIVLNDADSDANGVGNGGGLSNQSSGGAVTFSNTILGDNRDLSPPGGDAFPDCENETGATMTSQGYNLIENTAGCTGGSGTAGIVGETATNITGQDPRLEPLGNYGGPTPTHNPRAKSPVVDAGNPANPGSAPACEPADQRGVPRPQGSRCDIGAVERSQATEKAKDRCQGKAATILGTNASELLVGTPRKDVIVAGSGDDRVRAGNGRDIVCGGKGNDRLGGGRGPDNLLGQADNDRLRGQTGKDLLLCGPGVDRGKGGPGRDVTRKCESGRA